MTPADVKKPNLYVQLISCRQMQRCSHASEIFAVCRLQVRFRLSSTAAALTYTGYAGNSTRLSESLHVVLSCHFQHGAAAAHTDVVFYEEDTSTVQGLDIKVFSQGTDWKHIVWGQVALCSVAEAEHILQGCRGGVLQSNLQCTLYVLHICRHKRTHLSAMSSETSGRVCERWEAQYPLSAWLARKACCRLLKLPGDNRSHSRLPLLLSHR